MIKAKHIRIIRASNGWSQKELAIELGVNVTTVWRWETEKLPITGPAQVALGYMYNDAMDEETEKHG